MTQIQFTGTREEFLAKAREMMTEEDIEAIARHYHDRTGDNYTVDWDRCKPRYRTQVRKMVRNVLDCAALQTPHKANPK